MDEMTVHESEEKQQGLKEHVSIHSTSDTKYVGFPHKAVL